MFRRSRCIVVGGDAERLGCLEQWVRKLPAVVEVSGFTRALDALEYLECRRVDAIITELVVPDLHGLLLMEAVRQYDAAVPMILVSPDLGIRAEALASGASAVVAWSAAADELAATLAQHIAPVRKRRGAVRPEALLSRA